MRWRYLCQTVALALLRIHPVSSEAQEGLQLVCFMEATCGHGRHPCTRQPACLHAVPPAATWCAAVCCCLVPTALLVVVLPAHSSLLIGCSNPCLLLPLAPPPSRCRRCRRCPATRPAPLPLPLPEPQPGQQRAAAGCRGAVWCYWTTQGSRWRQVCCHSPSTPSGLLFPPVTQPF